MCHNFNFLQEIVKTGDLSWNNVDYFCHWQSQILNHAKFSGELEIDNYCGISDEVKYNINDDITSNENIENVDKSMDPFIDDDDLETNENKDAENLVSISFKLNRKQRVQRSAVHEHYNKVKIFHPDTEQHSDGSICKHCKAKFSNRVSTNLKLHLKSKHPEVFDEVQRKYNVYLSY